MGIHSGKTCRVRLHREEGPIRFRRGKAEIPALLSAVSSTDRCVVLAQGGAKVAVVEHLLAALNISGFWSGVVVEVEGEELPILDGSALPWQEEIAPLGEAPPAPLALIPQRGVTLEGGLVEVAPGKPRLEVNVDYPHPAIGRQQWTGGPDLWPQLLDARTFGFLEEFETLRSLGLALGANTENAIVFDDSGPIEPLRHADEPVRHKALDLLGDLALLGRPLHAAVRVDCGSHRVHVDLMHQLQQLSSTKVAT